ncbi:MAG: cupin domain-containing protein [Actinobacteria bacterium]|nr:cupin domain-containing protein [Actinomycetota bacterium]
MPKGAQVTKLSNDKMEIFFPTCNLETAKDGRGGIFTWVPQDKLVEFNLLYFSPGATRGNHYHPEFVEYSLVVDGSGIMVYRNKSGKESILHISKGTCVRLPSGVIHAIYAITNLTVVALLTKPWDDCEVPIVRVDIFADKRSKDLARKKSSKRE